jgi:metallo-beta-lactamase family protein
MVGYQSHGSLGRMLVDGKKSVKIFGESIPVCASVHTFGGLSGHAGQSDLLRWFDTLAPSRPRVIFTHGEERGQRPLGRIFKERYRLNVECPGLGDLITD